MSLLTAPSVKKSHFGRNIFFDYFSKKMYWTKLESLSIPDWDASEKIGKVFIK